MQAQTSSADVRAPGVSLGSLIMIAGGLLIAIGSMFPWVDLLGDLADVPVEANKTAILIAGVLTFCAGIVFSIQRPRFQLFSMVAGGASIAALILLIEILFDLQARFDKPIDLTGVLAWPFWFALMGSFAGVAGAFRIREKPPRMVPADEVVEGSAVKRSRPGWARTTSWPRPSSTPSS